MNLIDHFLGYYEVQIISENCKRFFNICSHHNLVLWEVEKISLGENNTTYQFFLSSQFYEKILIIAEKTDTKIIFLKEMGVPSRIKYIKKHIWFMIGAVMALFLLVILSNRIWDIEIDGNRYYDTQMILRDLKLENIYAGMESTKIDCLQLSARIREQYEKITWTSVEIDGCKLIIHMKENVIDEEKEQLNYGEQAIDLVAEKGGIIKDILVRQGISQVDTGQQIEKGTVLISGWIPIYNDGAEIIRQEPVLADGDVTLLSSYSYYHEINRNWYEYAAVKESLEPIIQIGNYRWKGIFYLGNERKEKDNSISISVTEKKQVAVTDTWLLPLEIGVKKNIQYEKREKSYTDSQLKALSEEEFYYFCRNLEKKGVQIYENNVKMYMSDASCVMTGNISVIEKIGILKQSDFLLDDGNQMEE